MAKKAAADIGVVPVEDPTVEQTERFHVLLCEIGIDNILDRALEAALAAAPAPKSGRSDWTKPAPESAPEEQDDADEAAVQFDLGPLFLKIMRAGAARRLAEIVLEGTPEDVARAPMSLVVEGLRFFVADSMRLVGVLIGFGNGLASPPPSRPSAAT